MMKLMTVMITMTMKCSMEDKDDFILMFHIPLILIAPHIHSILLLVL